MGVHARDARAVRAGWVHGSGPEGAAVKGREGEVSGGGGEGGEMLGGACAVFEHAGSGGGDFEEGGGGGGGVSVVFFGGVFIFLSGARF